MGNTIYELETLKEEMQQALDWSRSLSYYALGVLLIVVVMAMMVLGKRWRRCGVDAAPTTIPFLCFEGTLIERA